MIRAIIVDDEPLMVRKFVRLAKNISDLDVVGHFTDAENAIAFSRDNEIEAAFLDVEMPDMDGFELAHRLKEIRSDVLIVPVTAYESYIFEANRVGVDYYVVKPYTTEVLEKMMGRLRLIAGRQGKSIYIQTFGRFVVRRMASPFRSLERRRRSSPWSSRDAARRSATRRSTARFGKTVPATTNPWVSTTTPSDA